MATLTGENGTIGKAGESKFKTELSAVAEEYELYLTERIANDRSFEEGALYAGKNALIYDSVQEEGNIYTVLKNSNKKYVDNFEVIKGELFYFSQNENEKKWAQEIGIKVSPYIIIDGELMSSDRNLDLMDPATGSIVIPQNVTKIGAGAFRDLKGLRSIVIPGTVKEIAAYAFSGNSTLENVIIEEGVQIIYSYAFADCTSLKRIEFPQSLTEMWNYVMWRCTSLDNVVLPPNIKVINAGTFEGCTNLKNIKLPENLDEIKGYAITSSKIERLEIPASVTKIMSTAFVDNYKITEIILDNNKVYKYENGICMKKDGTEIIFIADNILKSSPTFEIPEGTKVFATPIRGYYNIKKLIIPASLTNIQVEMLPTSLEEISVEANSNTFSVSEGCLYSNNNKNLVCCFSKEKNITINTNVEIIDRFSFKLATNAENIILSDTVKTIEMRAFSENLKLQQLRLGKNVEYINPEFKAFNYSGNVTIDEENPNYKIENNIMYSKNGQTLFSVLYRIENEFILDENVTKIANSAFFYQSNMQKLICFDNLSIIEGNSVFYQCSKLREIIIDKKEGEISGAPWGCPYGLRAIFWKK